MADDFSPNEVRQLRTVARKLLNEQMDIETATMKYGKRKANFAECLCYGPVHYAHYADREYRKLSKHSCDHAISKPTGGFAIKTEAAASKDITPPITETPPIND